MKAPRIAVLGSGPIIDHHLRAMIAAGLNPVAISSMRRDSKRAKAVGGVYGIQHFFDSWEEMIDPKHGWDGVLIATHIDGLSPALERSFQLKVPLFVEKPVAWSVSQIDDLIEEAQNPVLVNYNRRKYSSVLAARKFAQIHSPILATFVFPETELDIRTYLGNSCHGMDTMRFIFGDLTVCAVHRMEKMGQLRGYQATLESVRGDIVTVIGNWGTPSNMLGWLDVNGERLELRPMEVAHLYRDMVVIEPTQAMPIRQYVPRLAEQVKAVDSHGMSKPGFLEQHLAFLDLIRTGRLDEDSATLADARDSLSLAYRCIGHSDD